ncbi:hypothetical protein [Mucilaginibacter myungsuensis]|uniref:Uncharacterized protein n=1 Tax=Mucilaginibacter myungsuensis TaxID=649104 RepID=A0A929L1S1_9SPHI|nr:hypothetical protein [Mucilaginibacter myungsuensis]MBE9662909.1 hypothetical protein [Mucilaginibacter myungsuensis]MDN3598529.1 hypothetical protein [Mucilaginibacter myungsuensis]
MKLSAVWALVLTQNEPTAMDILNSFVQFATANNYEAKLLDGIVYLYNVKNPGNDFKIMEVDNYYAVYTMRVSKLDYEYTPKCMIYILLADYNKSHSLTNHLHINFKVEL